MKEKIEVFDYASEILKSINKGILLTTKAGDKVNTMTIGWGSLGVEWRTNIFIAYIRENRFTATQLQENAEFTVNVPLGDFDKKIIGICGSKSGLKTDKIKEAGLDLIESDVVSVPGIKQFPLTLECKVIYKKLQDKDQIEERFNKQFYPQDVASDFPGANKDYHYAIYGEIVNAYIAR
ncbi:flavin reductase [Mycoplasma sp. P36-A1]|uniref:flavin reductase n=1 Tax=Mycoplasma sp. P36-A1 TaxID=3252900 RepID=UPI003C2B6F54